jgi:hypothetical protein
MEISRRAQNYTEIDGDAEEFIRGGIVHALSASRRGQIVANRRPDAQTDQISIGIEPVAQPHSAAERVDVRERNGI